jgi:hypothetical protein
MYSLATPPIKLKLGQQIGRGLLITRVLLVITNHLDQSLWWANQKHWAAVRSYLLNSLLQVHSAAEPFTSHGNVRNYTEPKSSSWVKPACVTFSSSILTLQDHRLSTGGDALRNTLWIFYGFAECAHFRSAPDQNLTHEAGNDCSSFAMYNDWPRWWDLLK